MEATRGFEMHLTCFNVYNDNLLRCPKILISVAVTLRSGGTLIIEVSSL
jgi:hypothetical protein